MPPAETIAPQEAIEEIKAFYLARLQHLATDLQGDLVAYIEAAANDFIAAALIPDQARRQETFNELRDQSALMVEVGRLKAINASWDMVDKSVNTGLQLLLQFATKAIVLA